jgi:hypothetical protein
MRCCVTLAFPISIACNRKLSALLPLEKSPDAMARGAEVVAGGGTLEDGASGNRFRSPRELIDQRYDALLVGILPYREAQLARDCHCPLRLDLSDASPRRGSVGALPDLRFAWICPLDDPLCVNFVWKSCQAGKRTSAATSTEEEVLAPRLL